MSPAAAPRDPIDPKNLIFEAYRIEGITDGECRSILVDWALSIEAPDPRPLIEALLARHADAPEGIRCRPFCVRGCCQRPRRAAGAGGRARVAD